MRYIVLGFVVILVACACLASPALCDSGVPDAPTDWGPASEGFQLHAEVVWTSAGGMAAASLRIVRRNITDVPLAFVKVNPLASCTPVVQDDMGHVLQMRPNAWIQNPGLTDVTGCVSATLRPGDEYECVYPLSRVYDLSPGATYHVTITDKVFRLDGGGTGVVTSNPVRLTVPPMGQIPVPKSAVGASVPEAGVLD